MCHSCFLPFEKNIIFLLIKVYFQIFTKLLKSLIIVKCLLKSVAKIFSMTKWRKRFNSAASKPDKKLYLELDRSKRQDAAA